MSTDLDLIAVATRQITIQIAPITIKRMPIMGILFSTSVPSYGRYDRKERMPILKLLTAASIGASSFSGLFSRTATL